MSFVETAYTTKLEGRGKYLDFVKGFAKIISVKCVSVPGPSDRIFVEESLPVGVRYP
jgi:hypothetical protein